MAKDKKSTNDGSKDSYAARPNSRNNILEWVKVIGPILISWPMLAILVVLLFRTPIVTLFDRFTSSESSRAQIGPLTIELGPPVIPPQYRETPDTSFEVDIDLSSAIGEIRDTGPEGTTVGFAVAYALQAMAYATREESLTLSPRGIYVLGKKYDKWPGTHYEGTSVAGGLEAVQKVGAYLEDDWPYSNLEAAKTGSKPAIKISSYVEVTEIELIIKSLEEGRIVIAEISVTEDFDEVSSSGKVTIRLPLETMGGKAIAIVGYNAETAEFKFANDWGAQWGANGFGVIRDSDLKQLLWSAYVAVP